LKCLTLFCRTTQNRKNT